MSDTELLNFLIENLFRKTLSDEPGLEGSTYWNMEDVNQFFYYGFISDDFRTGLTRMIKEKNG